MNYTLLTSTEKKTFRALLEISRAYKPAELSVARSVANR